MWVRGPQETSIIREGNVNGLPCRFAHNAQRKKRRVRLFRDDNLDLAFLS